MLEAAQTSFSGTYSKVSFDHSVMLLTNQRQWTTGTPRCGKTSGIILGELTGHKSNQLQKQDRTLHPTQSHSYEVLSRQN